jgi:hypothetical protein
VYLESTQIDSYLNLSEDRESKSYQYVHSTVDRVHRRWLMGLQTSLNTGCWLPDRRLRLNQANRYLGRSSPIRRLRRLAPTVGGADSRSRWRIVAERGGSPEFEFSQATVVGFRGGLLLWDHNDKGNVFMLTFIGGEQQ